MENITLEKLAEEKIKEATFYLNKKNITRGFKLLREATMLSPNNAKILNLYASYSLCFNMLENAKYFYDRANKITIGKFNEECEFLNSDKVKKYKEFLDKVFEFIKLNDFKKALKQINLVLKYVDKEFTFKIIDLYLIKIFILINLKKFKEAKKIGEIILSNDMGNIKAREYLEFIESKI